MIYTARSDTSSLHLPTIKRGLVVTNGPHAHGTATLGDPALICRPRELIHPFLAAQVRADKSSLLGSQLQGHHSVAIEDCLDFVNFIFYWSSWQCGALSPLPSGEAWFPIHPHSPPAPTSTGLAVQPSRRRGVPAVSPRPLPKLPQRLWLSCLWERVEQSPVSGQGRRQPSGVVRDAAFTVHTQAPPTHSCLVTMGGLSPFVNFPSVKRSLRIK